MLNETIYKKGKKNDKMPFQMMCIKTDCINMKWKMKLIKILRRTLF